MDKITAAVLMSASISALLSAERVRLAHRGRSDAPRDLPVFLVAAFSGAWAVDNGEGLPSSLILLFTPIGAAWAGMILGNQFGEHISDRRLIAVAVVFLIVLFLIAYGVGFPPTLEDEV